MAEHTKRSTQWRRGSYRSIVRPSSAAHQHDPPHLAPSCQEAGVLGILCGIVGTVQATEAIKILLGKGTTLGGRLLTYDSLKMKFRELKLRRDPRCPVCGPEPVIKSFIDYEDFCAVG